MITTISTESKSYRDPLGEHIGAAKSAWDAYRQKFPPVTSVYDGFYAEILPLDSGTIKDSQAFFLGPEGIIGTPVTISDGFVVAPNGRLVAKFNDGDSNRLSYHKSNNWQITAYLSLVLFHNETKSPSGQLACICYDSGLTGSIAPFAKNMAFRISKGEHPLLTLTQDQFIRVLESKGTWYLTKADPLPPRPKGTVIYKKRRTWTENIVEMALKGKIGCKIANAIFWFAVAGATMFGAWWFFFRE